MSNLNTDPSTSENRCTSDVHPIIRESPVSPQISKSVVQKAQSTLEKVKEATKEIVQPEFMHEFDEQLKNVKSKENAKPQNEHQPDQHKHAINIISFFKSRFLSLSYYKNNAVYFATILVYFLLSILFVLIQLLVFFPTAMWYVQMARAAGILLNFNSCLVF